MSDTEKIIQAVEQAMEKAGVVGGGAFEHLVFNTSVQGLFVGVGLVVLCAVACYLSHICFKQEDVDAKIVGGWLAVFAVVCVSGASIGFLQWIAPHGFVIENILSRL